MIIIYAPAIKTLVDTIIAYTRETTDMEEVRKAKEEALKFSREALARFLFQSKSRVREAESEKIYRKLVENMQIRIDKVQSVEAILETKNPDIIIRALQAIEDVSFEIFDRGVAFQNLQDSFKKLSPLPFYDDFLKLAVAVNNDWQDYRALRERIPFVMQRLEALEDDYKRLSRFYAEETDLIKNFQRLLKDLEMGIGAIFTYTETRDKKDLMSGIRIISVITSEIYNVLLLIDATRREKGFSPIPQVDEFIRAAKMLKLGAVSDKVFTGELHNLKKYLDEIYIQLNDFKRNMMVNLSVEKEYEPKFQEKYNHISGLLTKAGESQPQSAQFKDIVRDIGAGFEELFNMRLDYGEKATMRKDLSAIISLGELQEAVVGVYQGVVTYTTLEEMLIRNIQRFQALIRRIRRLPRDNKTDDLETKVQKMLEALHGLTSFFVEFNPAVLSSGMEMVEAALEGVLDAEDKIAAMEQEGGTIKCVKCGADNQRGELNCFKCSAQLPVVMQSDATGFEALETDTGQALIRDGKFKMPEIMELEEIIRQAEKGEKVDDQLNTFITTFTGKLKGAKAQVKAFIQPAIDRNPNDQDLQQGSIQFKAALLRFEKAFGEISLYLIYHHVRYLEKGYHLLLSAQENFVVIMNEVNRLVSLMEAEV